ncbi:MAG TPA: DUF6152 family protein [Gammaproteobacteria bacterium]
MRTYRKLALLAIGIIAGSVSGVALAHHAFAAEFDRERPVKLTGVVTEMKWSNPHAWLYLDVEEENGNVVNWAFETRAANALIRLGWRPADLPVGTELEVEGYRARNDTPTASLSSAVFSDGRLLFRGSPDTEN